MASTYQQPSNCDDASYDEYKEDDPVICFTVDVTIYTTLPIVPIYANAND